MLAFVVGLFALNAFAQSATDAIDYSFGNGGRFRFTSD